MDFEKIEKAIEKSSEKAKELIFSEEIGIFLGDLADRNKLSEEIGLKLIDEVGYVILGIKERSSLKKSLYDLGIEQGAVLAMIQEISRKIFTELDKMEPINDAEPTTNPPMPEESGEKEEPPTASSNLPMVEEGEVAHEVPHVDIPVPATAPSVSINEVKPEKPQVEVPTPNYTYQKGQDPYREPLE